MEKSTSDWMAKPTTDALRSWRILTLANLTGLSGFSPSKYCYIFPPVQIFTMTSSSCLSATLSSRTSLKHSTYQMITQSSVLDLVFVALISVTMASPMVSVFVMRVLVPPSLLSIRMESPRSASPEKDIFELAVPIRSSKTAGPASASEVISSGKSSLIDFRVLQH
ncbi:hypothetical protein K432DRAFT_380787 [Lepidopterella palustris CBS 459.81]|uniref:Uncharacterized protein n=1 Tax=Lepidopterella palustris CBS 459.81 TaxID=1314670 RepID=A0A8E2JGQ5_9PEZI|nr:hypothetical protein K432DRAFT_380787 [Lepidopterella palustris CBS 459.81]